MANPQQADITPSHLDPEVVRDHHLLGKATMTLRLPCLKEDNRNLNLEGLHHLDLEEGTSRSIPLSGQACSPHYQLWSSVSA